MPLRGDRRTKPKAATTADIAKVALAQSGQTGDVVDITSAAAILLTWRWFR